MGLAPAIVVGLFLGLVGSLPPAVLFELALSKRRSVGVAAGLASILASFSVLSGGILAVRLVAQQDVLVFGVSAVASFLLVWVVEAWKGWRAAQGEVDPTERKRGESSR